MHPISVCCIGLLPTSVSFKQPEPRVLEMPTVVRAIATGGGLPAKDCQGALNATSQVSEQIHLLAFQNVEKAAAVVRHPSAEATTALPLQRMVFYGRGEAAQLHLQDPGFWKFPRFKCKCCKTREAFSRFSCSGHP